MTLYVTDFLLYILYILACFAYALQYNIFMMCCCSLPEIVNILSAYANKHFTQKSCQYGKRAEDSKPGNSSRLALPVCLFVCLPICSAVLFLLFVDVADTNRIVAISISQHNKSFSIVFVFMQRQRK